MNFFNFKRKHWIIAGIFFFFNVAMIIGFAIFMDNLSKKTRKTVQASLIPADLRIEEEKASKMATSSMGTLSVEVGACKLSADKK